MNLMQKNEEGQPLKSINLIRIRKNEELTGILKDISIVEVCRSGGDFKSITLQDSVGNIAKFAIEIYDLSVYIKEPPPKVKKWVVRGHITIGSVPITVDTKFDTEKEANDCRQHFINHCDILSLTITEVEE